MKNLVFTNCSRDRTIQEFDDVKDLLIGPMEHHAGAKLQ